jgi:hypothetical protein
MKPGDLVKKRKSSGYRWGDPIKGVCMVVRVIPDSEQGLPYTSKPGGWPEMYELLCNGELVEAGEEEIELVDETR